MRAPLSTLAIRGLNYVTNHVVNRIPSFGIRHAWYSKILGIRLAPGAAIHMGCFIWFYGPGHLRRTGSSIGPRARINRNCCLDMRAPVHIGADVSISPEVAILTTQHDIDVPGFPLESRGVTVEDHAFVGMRATLLPGTRLGRGAVVAAGAVATGDVPKLTVVGGVPARPIGVRDEGGLQYHLDEPPPLFE